MRPQSIPLPKHQDSRALSQLNPIDEDSLMTGPLEPTNSPYAMAKIAAIEMGDAISKQYGNKVIEPFKTLADNSKALLILDWDPKGDLSTWIKEYKQKLGI